MTSVGNRSGVHCTRLNLQPTLLASALASIVFATPGTSSNKMCPPLNHVTSDNTSCLRFPTIACSTFPMIRFDNSPTSAVVLIVREAAIFPLFGCFLRGGGPESVPRDGFESAGSTFGALIAFPERFQVVVNNVVIAVIIILLISRVVAMLTRGHFNLLLMITT